MTDNNRGAYTPQSDAPLAFDARRSSAGGQRPLPLTLIVSALILLVLVIGALILYKNGARKTGDAPAAVGAPVAPAVTPQEAKPVAATPGLQVYADGEPVATPPTLAPPPEQPAPRPAPAAPTALRPAQVVATPAPVTAPPPAAKLAAAPPAPPAAKVAPVAPAAPPPAVKTLPAPSSSAMVQIGAFSSTALADAGWNRVARLMPGDMVGKTKKVEQVDRDGQTLYRALVGGFASRTEADAFCSTLRNQKVDCQVKN